MGRMIIGAAIAAGALALAVPAWAETLGNADVLALLDAGLGDEAVIAKIETADAAYTVDTATLLALRQRGVSSAVVAAMVKRANAPTPFSDSSPNPAAPHFPGLYLFDDWSAQQRMWKIDPTSSTQTKTGGIFGYALTGGLASVSVKAVIPGETAPIAAPRAQPAFYVYFDSTSGGSSGTFSTGFGASIQSPNEFSLVRLMRKEGRREARIGSVNIAGAKAGVMDKDQVPFDYETLAPGVFKIIPKVALTPGEYGFIFAVGGGVGPGLAGSAGTAGARVFAFSISGTAD